MDNLISQKPFFNPEQAPIFRLIKSFWIRFFRVANFIGLVCLIFSFLAIVLNLTSDLINWQTDEFWLGFSLLMLGLSGFFWSAHLFYISKLKKINSKFILKKVFEQKGNIADCFDFESANLFAKTDKEEGLFRPDQLAKVLFSEAKELDFILSRMMLNREVVLKRIKIEIEKTVWSNPTVSREEMILAAAERALAQKRTSITVNDLIWATFRFSPLLNEILIEQELTMEDTENIIQWYERLRYENEKMKRFWDYDNLLQKGSLARHWAAAYTITIDEYSRDLTQIARKERSRLNIFGHETEVEQVENILASSGRNNVLLVGQPGSGRMEIVKTLAAKSFWNSSLPPLNGKRVMELDLSMIIARAPSIEEVESILDNCFQEAIAMSNVILVIRDLENFVGGTQVGAVDISGLLAKYLESPRFQVIAITSYTGFHNQIQKLSALLNLFNKVEVAPSSPHQTLCILEYLVPEFEYRYGKFIPYIVLKRTVERSARYLQEKPFPQKSIDLLDEVMVYASRHTKSSSVEPDWVDEIISRRAEVPIGRIQSSEKEMLLNLEDLIHQKVINQEEAVAEVSAALRRARAEVTTKRSQPMGSFLFLGPTGVGKTETAKALTDIYFGSLNKMIRIDMSEFQSPGDIYRLIGGEGQAGLLAFQVRENPFSLVLLDEIEKAHPDILNLFLTILDEGYFTDGFGQKVTFSDTIIVATSNAGAELIRKDIEADKTLDLVKNDLLDYLMENKYFRPELINRFTAVVVFKTLTQEHLLKIAGLMLGRMSQSLAEKGIEFEANDDLKKEIVRLGYRPAFGAREMERVVQDRVGNALAQAILKDEIKRGDRVTIDKDGFRVRII